MLGNSYKTYRPDSAIYSSQVVPSSEKSLLPPYISLLAHSLAGSAYKIFGSEIPLPTGSLPQLPNMVGLPCYVFLQHLAFAFVMALTLLYLHCPLFIWIHTTVSSK